MCGQSYTYLRLGFYIVLQALPQQRKISATSQAARAVTCIRFSWHATAQVCTCVCQAVKRIKERSLASVDVLQCKCVCSLISVALRSV